MATSISTSIISCLKAFNAFVAEVQDLEKNNPASLLVQAWQDELGRLRIWAANIGAHQTNQSSLDYRLRDSSHVRQQIKNLLDELLNRLHEAGKTILEDEPDDDDDIESLEDSSSEGEASQTDVHRLHKSVATLVTCLFQMSMLVRKPAQHDLRIGSKAAEVAAFEPFDYNHVRDKYPQAEGFVVARLGHANTRRRQYLKYRERHALKLKHGIINAVADMDDNKTSDLGLSETIATDVQNWNVRFDDKASQSGISQTSYAPTLMGGGDITIPTPPRDSRGGILKKPLNDTIDTSLGICKNLRYSSYLRRMTKNQTAMSLVLSQDLEQVLHCPDQSQALSSSGDVCAHKWCMTCKSWRAGEDGHPDITMGNKEPTNDQEGPVATAWDGSEEKGSNVGLDKRSITSAAEEETARYPEYHPSGAGNFWPAGGRHSPFAATTQASQGDNVLANPPGGLNPRDLATSAGKEPLQSPQPSAEGHSTWIMDALARGWHRNDYSEDPDFDPNYGQILRDDVRPCRDYGLKQNSEIMFVISEASSLPSYQQFSSDSASDD
ncbi:MAG: hypothetical protein Q9221_002486 [Calogaya cf. arnoldii]